VGDVASGEGVSCPPQAEPPVINQPLSNLPPKLSYRYLKVFFGASGGRRGTTRRMHLHLTLAHLVSLSLSSNCRHHRQSFSRNLPLLATFPTIAHCHSQPSTDFYLGKKLCYIYKAHTKKKGTVFRTSWGKVTRAHGTSGVVRAKVGRDTLFAHSVPPPQKPNQKNLPNHHGGCISGTRYTQGVVSQV